MERCKNSIFSSFLLVFLPPVGVYDELKGPPAAESKRHDNRLSMHICNLPSQHPILIKNVMGPVFHLTKTNKSMNGHSSVWWERMVRTERGTADRQTHLLCRKASSLTHHSHLLDRWWQWRPAILKRMSWRITLWEEVFPFWKRVVSYRTVLPYNNTQKKNPVVIISRWKKCQTYKHQCLKQHRKNVSKSCLNGKSSEETLQQIQKKPQYDPMMMKQNLITMLGINLFKLHQRYIENFKLMW